MLLKYIQYCGQPVLLVCDGNCTKAWGISSRPTKELSKKEDDFEYLSDNELGDAPANPGTSEGFQCKPIEPEERLNKWCARECERSDMWPLYHGQPTTPIARIIEIPSAMKIKDFSKRIKNIP